MSADRVLQVFARAPVLGRVKTRLGHEIGTAAALHWYRILLHRTLLTASLVSEQVEIWCPSQDDPIELEQMVHGLNVTFHEQCSGDLGARMEFALKAGLKRASKALLIGADCPVWTAETLGASVQALSTASMVLIPADDGGYVGIGASDHVPPVFEGVSWGSSSVSSQTRRLMRAAGVNWAELPSLWDVDRSADLDRWLRVEPNLPRPIVS
ncbi:MAG: TIGR04282 family arsenosugar biosynthesis glycosyltransferase [Pseudomonadales bacterium]